MNTITVIKVTNSRAKKRGREGGKEKRGITAAGVLALALSLWGARLCLASSEYNALGGLASLFMGHCICWPV